MARVKMRHIHIHRHEHQPIEITVQPLITSTEGGIIVYTNKLISMSEEALSKLARTQCTAICLILRPCVMNRSGPEGQHLWSLFLMAQYKEASEGH